MCGQEASLRLIAISFAASAFLDESGISEGQAEMLTRLALVTLGKGGARYLAAPPAGQPGALVRRSFIETSDAASAEGRILRGEVTIGSPREDGDPTGAGDVWGAAMVAHLLRGDEPRVAVSAARAERGRSFSAGEGVALARELLCGVEHGV